MMARGVGFLPPLWETCTDFLAPGFGLVLFIVGIWVSEPGHTSLPFAQ